MKIKRRRIFMALAEQCYSRVWVPASSLWRQIAVRGRMRRCSCNNAGLRARDRHGLPFRLRRADTVGLMFVTRRQGAQNRPMTLTVQEQAQGEAWHEM